MIRNLGIIVILCLLVFVLGSWLRILNAIQVVNLNPVQGAAAVPEIADHVLYQLRGQWHYYPDRLIQSPAEAAAAAGQFVKVEHGWDTPAGSHNEYGVASYSLTLTGLDPAASYGLFVQDEFSAYRLSVNGQPVMTNGTVATSARDYVAQVYTTTGYFVPSPAGEAVIIMEIANFTRSSGGFAHAPLLGRAAAVGRSYNHLMAVEVFILAFILAFGLFFAILNSFERESSSLLLSVLALLIVLRIISTGNHLIQIIFPRLPVTIILQLEYLSGYLMVPVAGLLFQSFGLVPVNRILNKVFLGLIPALIALVLFSSNYILTESFPVARFFILAMLLYSLWMCIQALRHKKEGVIYIIIGYVILAIGALLEISTLNLRLSLFFASMFCILLLAVFVVIRLTSIKLRNQLLESEVLTDHLTGLGSRAALFRRLDELKQRYAPPNSRTANPAQDKAQPAGRMYNILFLDLNRFKYINDTYGHVIGDAILRLSARRIRECAIEADLVCRFGGDEFVILAEFKSEADTSALIQRLKESLSRPYHIEDLTLEISVSIGAELFRPATDSVDVVISKSDKRMYEDKRHMHEAERQPREAENTQ